MTAGIIRINKIVLHNFFVVDSDFSFSEHGYYRVCGLQ